MRRCAREGQIGAKALAAIDVLQVVKVVAVPGGNAGVEGIASPNVLGYIDSLAGHGLRGEHPDGIELDAGVDSFGAIVAAGEFTVRDEEDPALDCLANSRCIRSTPISACLP